MARTTFSRIEIAVSDNTGLSERREQVMELLAQGYQHKEIAQKLGISPETVRCHIESLCDQFAARNRIDLISQGWIHGVLQARALALVLITLTALAGAPSNNGNDQIYRTRSVRTSTAARLRRQEIHA